MAGLDLGDMSAYERMLYGNVEDDPDLEAELMAIQNELGDDDDDESSIFNSTKPPSRARQVVAAGRRDIADIDRLARQISQEINVEDDENDATVDDDQELLAELSSVVSDDYVAPTSKRTSMAPAAKNVQADNRDLIVLIEDRLTNYKTAQESAKEAGDAAKLRRLDRGIAVIF